MYLKNASLQFFGRIFVVVTVALFCFNACHSSTDEPYRTIETAAGSDSLTNIGQVHANYAEGFSISYFRNYKLIKVFNPFTDQSDTLRYVLVPRGEAPPEGYPKAQVIEIPVESMIATSTTHIALTEMLDANEVITGIAGAKFVYNPDLRQRVKSGEIISFASASFNKEKALAMDPDLIMLSAGQASHFNDYRLLVELGIPVFVNAEWLETTPLGKAEWVKVMAALLNKESLANKRFGEVARRYKQLKQLVAENVEQKPLVITNLPYKGAWFVSGGSSFTAQYLKDAGTDYPWFVNNETGGLNLGFEAVYAKGLKADVWINPGAASGLQELLAKDARFKDFKSFQTGRIYNNNKRMSPAGGNDFWEIGVVRPDLVLHDLINIFHPGLLDSDSLYFYQKLTWNTNNADYAN